MSNCGNCGQNNRCACFFSDSCQAIGEFYVDLPGTAGNYISTPDSAALSITGDIDIRVKVAMDDWTPSANSTLLAKQLTAGNQASYRLFVGTTGLLRFSWSADGAAVTTLNSTVATGVTDGATKWVRVTFDVDNGAAGNDAKFYTSNDGTNWAQLGTTVTTAGVASIFNSTANVEIGSFDNGTTQLAAGNVYYAEIRNGIDGPIVGVFDSADAVPVPTSGTQIPSTVTSSSTGEVWTLNGAGWFWGQDSDLACVTVLGNGFGGNHSTVSPFLDPLLAGPFKFKSNNAPDPYPMGYVFRTTTQAVAASTITVIGFDDSPGWPGDMQDFGAHPQALTVSEDGIYLVGLNLLTVDSTAAASQIAYVRKNATSHNIMADQIGTAINGLEERGQGFMTLIDLVAGDYLEAAVFITSATTISISYAGPVSATPHLWARWMGPL